MDPVLDGQEHHHRLRQKLKDSFTLVYMTALSVIQGVALADLAGNVASDYHQFTVTHWLLTLLTFGVLIAIWYQYMMYSLLWDWMPDLRDAVFPFLIGALELFLNHTIFASLSAWLIVYAILFLMGALTTVHTGIRAREEVENLKMLNLLNERHRVFMLSMLGIAALLLLLALVSRLASIEASQSIQTGAGLLALAFLLLIAGCYFGLALFTIDYWNRVLNYARTGRIPTRRKTQIQDSSNL